MAAKVVRCGRRPGTPRRSSAQVNEAYEVLSDPNKRAIFDRGGDPTGSGRRRDPPTWAVSAGSASAAGQGLDIGDLFGAMFGGGLTTRGPSRCPARSDQLIRARLTLSEAVFGVTKPIKFDTHVVCATCSGSGGANKREPVTCTQCHGRGEVIISQRSIWARSAPRSRARTAKQGNIPEPCPDHCSGQGRVPEQRSINVKIPSPVSTHRQSGPPAGLVSWRDSSGAAGGDLDVEIQVAPHDVFRRDHDNLEMVACCR